MDDDDDDGVPITPIICLVLNYSFPWMLKQNINFISKYW